MVTPKILIVDDDENIAELISLYLNREHYDTESAQDGETALKLVESYDPDLILLDLMLPGMDGYEVCQQIRRTRQTPIIMLSAKGEVFDKVLGLKMGADDYTIKPFDSNEMVARAQAVLRRTQRTEEPAAATPVSSDRKGEYVEYDQLIVNISNYTVTFRGRNVDMPPKELELLYFLASNYNRVFTRDQLLDKVWGFDYLGDSRTVDVHVKRLREKLEGVSDKWTLKTVWGVGYKFELIQ
jgi:DNA-binding response OmpR family regulator